MHACMQDPRRHPDVDAIRLEFATIKKLGFNALKQVMLTNMSAFFVESVFIAAIEEGLVPWWYGQAGWEAITPTLLSRLGIPLNASLEAAQSDPRMVAYQNQVCVCVCVHAC